MNLLLFPFFFIRFLECGQAHPAALENVVTNSTFNYNSGIYECRFMSTFIQSVTFAALHVLKTKNRSATLASTDLMETYIVTY